MHEKRPCRVRSLPCTQALRISGSCHTRDLLLSIFFKHGDERAGFFELARLIFFSRLFSWSWSCFKVVVLFERFSKGVGYILLEFLADSKPVLWTLMNRTAVVFNSVTDTCSCRFTGQSEFGFLILQVFRFQPSRLWRLCLTGGYFLQFVSMIGDRLCRFGFSRTLLPRFPSLSTFQSS